MEQQHLRNMRRALSHARTSPLGEYVDELAQQLVDQGYRHQAIQYAVRLVANFGHWMQQHKLTSPELTPEQFKRFWQYYTVHRSPRHGDHLTLRRLSSILVEKGVVAPAVQDELTPLQQLPTGISTRVQNLWLRRLQDLNKAGRDDHEHHSILPRPFGRVLYNASDATASCQPSYD